MLESDNPAIFTSGVREPHTHKQAGTHTHTHEYTHTKRTHSSTLKRHRRRALLSKREPADFLLRVTRTRIHTSGTQDNTVARDL